MPKPPQGAPRGPRSLRSSDVRFCRRAKHSLTACANVNDLERSLTFDVTATAPGALGCVPSIHIPPEHPYQIRHRDHPSVAAQIAG